MPVGQGVGIRLGLDIGLEIPFLVRFRVRVRVRIRVNHSFIATGLLLPLPVQKINQTHPNIMHPYV